MHYLILKMCANNVSVSSSRYICIALIFPSTQLCRKRTYCSSHIKRSCIRSSLFCGTNWASEGTTWGTQAIPPHPTPPFVSDPLSGVQEDGGGEGKRRGGGISRRGARLGGGEGEVGARKGICDLKTPPLLGKTQRTVHLVPSHFFPR